MMDVLFEKQQAYLRESGKTEAEIADWAKNVAPLRTPAGFAFSVLAQSLIYMFLVSVAGSLCVPKKSATYAG